ncbi:MAG: DNA repair protein RadC [Gammaproteobacteria bacterium]|nr:DNA repair protein RadC [Gammaproteobacteria bacterium]
MPKQPESTRSRAISHWPSAERPREKLLTSGADSLSDAELLAIFIRTGVQGKTAVDIGRDLISRFGSLRQVLISDQQSLCSNNGLGPAKYALIQAALEIGKRYLDQKLKHQGTLSSAKQAVDFLTHKLRDQQREVFAIVYLDNRHQVIHYDELFFGTINGATVYPREVVKSVLHHNAAAIIIAHNHPSGVSEPSHADNTITQKLVKALELVDVKLLDHLIIGDGEYVSLADRGVL